MCGCVRRPIPSGQNGSEALSIVITIAAVAFDFPVGSY